MMMREKEGTTGGNPPPFILLINCISHSSFACGALLYALPCRNAREVPYVEGSRPLPTGSGAPCGRV